MKQFIYFLSISLLLIGLNACNHQKDNNLNQNSEGYSEASNPTTVQKIDATLLHDKLMSSFSDDWIERESDPDLYPEYYGGSYVDNNGNFVIAVTGNADRNREALKEILNTENFRIETVSYSYRQMMKVMDEIDNFLVSSNIPDNQIGRASCRKEGRDRLPKALGSI